MLGSGEKQDGRRPRSSPLRRAAAWSLVVGLLVASSGWVVAAFVATAVTEQATRTLDTRVDAIEQATQSEVARYADALGLVAAALETASRIDAASFTTATRPLDSMRLAGASSLVFITPPVADDELADVQARWRARGSVGLELAPAEGVSDHAFAVLSTPLDGSSQRRTGVDVAGAPAPYEALMTAQESGAAAISNAYQLIIDQQLPEAERQTSFSITAPVLRQGRFAGWVLMGLRGEDFLGRVLWRAAEGRVGVDLVADDAAGDETLVASVPLRSGTDAQDDAQGLTRHVSRLPVAQRDWSLQITADDAALVGGARHRVLAVRLVSVVIALLAAGLWWMLLSSRARAMTAVRVATGDLARSEATARRQATLLNTMIEAIDEVGISVVDADSRFIVHSRAARRIWGAGAQDAERSSLPDDVEQGDDGYGTFRLDGSPFPPAELPITRALAGEATDDVEMVVRIPGRPDGVQVVVSSRPIDLGSGELGALTVVRDVTDERRHQAELAGFAGVVAHDLKSPLAVLGGYLELLSDDLVPQLQGPSDARDTAVGYLRRASSAYARVIELIDDLLAYSTARDAALEITDVDLDTLVRDAVAEIVAGHLAHRRSAGLPVVEPIVRVRDLPSARCDGPRIRQVVTNLVGNAIKYAAPDTRPVIDITGETQADGLGVRLLVADRGIGIPAHLRNEVVKPFVRTPTTSADTSRYPGTGLGLAICSRIVGRHGGSLRLMANPGGGTIALVDLPSPAPRAPAAAESPDAHAPGRVELIS